MIDLISRLRKAAHIEPEEVAELMEEAAAALEAARWQPIETAPRDGTEVLVLLNVASVDVAHIAWFNSEEEWERSGQYCASPGETKEEYIGWWSYTRGSVTQEKLGEYRTPTHWMPLPAPPKEAHNG